MFSSLELLLRAVGPIAGGALLWIQYFDLKDRLAPEPRRLLALGFVLGILAAGLGWVGYNLLPFLGLPGAPPADGAQLVGFCLFIVGPLEEGAKLALAWAVLFRMRQFDEPIDGLIYAAIVAIGFAAAENFFYAPTLEWWEQVARAFASPLIHSLFSAIWGFAAGFALLRGWRGWRRLGFILAAWLVASLLHGLYDAALLTLNAPWLASGLALVIWVFVIGYSRRLIRARQGR